MTSKFTPAPGVMLVEEIKEDNTPIQLQLKSKNRTVKGKILAVGPNVTIDGTPYEMAMYGKVGDTIFFLSYEGNYDVITISGKDYYVVKFQDLRGVLND